MKILLPLLWNPSFSLQLSPGLPPFQYPVILFGIDIERLLLKHFRSGKWNALLNVGGSTSSCATVWDHHDDILTILASPRNLNHLVALALAGFGLLLPAVAEVQCVAQLDHQHYLAPGAVTYLSFPVA